MSLLAVMPFEAPNVITFEVNGRLFAYLQLQPHEGLDQIRELFPAADIVFDSYSEHPLDAATRDPDLAMIDAFFGPNYWRHTGDEPPAQSGQRLIVLEGFNVEPVMGEQEINGEPVQVPIWGAGHTALLIEADAKLSAKTKTLDDIKIKLEGEDATKLAEAQAKLDAEFIKAQAEYDKKLADGTLLKDEKPPKTEVAKTVSTSVVDLPTLALDKPSKIETPVDPKPPKDPKTIISV